MELREVADGDRRELVRLFAACYPAWTWAGEIDIEEAADTVAGHFMERREALTWHSGAWDGGRLIGLTGFSPARQRRGKGPLIAGRAQLNYLYVEPGTWGRGVAVDLHTACLDRMRAHGFADTQLWAPARTPRSRAFYEREGWRCVGGRIDYLGKAELVRYRRTL